MRSLGWSTVPYAISLDPIKVDQPVGHRMNRFTAHTVNERECQYLDYSGSLLLAVLLFYESVLLQQKALFCQAILARTSYFLS